MRFFTFHYMTYQGIDTARVLGDDGVRWCTLPHLAKTIASFIDHCDG